MTFSFSFGLDTIFDPSEELSWEEKEALLAIRDREAEDALSVRQSFRMVQVTMTTDSNAVGSTTYIDAWSSGAADLKIRGRVGEWLLCNASFKWSNNATVIGACDMQLSRPSIYGDVGRYISSGATTAASEGVGAWFGNTNAEAVYGKGVGGSVWYQLQSGDVNNGYVTLRPRINASAASRNISANANYPAVFSVANYGQTS